MTAESGDLKLPNFVLTHQALNGTVIAAAFILQDDGSGSDVPFTDYARIRTWLLVSKRSCRLRSSWHEGCVEFVFENG